MLYRFFLHEVLTIHLNLIQKLKMIFIIAWFPTSFQGEKCRTMAWFSVQPLCSPYYHQCQLLTYRIFLYKSVAYALRNKMSLRNIYSIQAFSSFFSYNKISLNKVQIKGHVQSPSNLSLIDQIVCNATLTWVFITVSWMQDWKYIKKKYNFKDMVRLPLGQETIFEFLLC